jgi:uncharacterized membrane-anchored protein
MKNTRKNTQVTKASHHQRGSWLFRYVDLAGQAVLLGCAVADVTGGLPSSVRVVLAVSAVVHGILRG